MCDQIGDCVSCASSLICSWCLDSNSCVSVDDQSCLRIDSSCLVVNPGSSDGPGATAGLTVGGFFGGLLVCLAIAVLDCGSLVLMRRWRRHVKRLNAAQQERVWTDAGSANALAKGLPAPLPPPLMARVRALAATLDYNVVWFGTPMFNVASRYTWRPWVAYVTLNGAFAAAAMFSFVFRAPVAAGVLWSLAAALAVIQCVYSAAMLRHTPVLYVLTEREALVIPRPGFVDRHPFPLSVRIRATATQRFNWWAKFLFVGRLPPSDEPEAGSLLFATVKPYTTGYALLDSGSDMYGFMHIAQLHRVESIFNRFNAAAAAVLENDQYATVDVSDDDEGGGPGHTQEHRRSRAASSLAAPDWDTEKEEVDELFAGSDVMFTDEE